MAVWASVLAGIFVRMLLAKPGSHSVVPIFTAAARHWCAGEDLYRPLPTDQDIFRYPPPAAVLFVPLTLLPVTPAGILWRCLSAAVFLFGLERFRRSAAPWLHSPTQRGLLFLLAAPMAAQSLNNGQTNTLLAGLLLLSAAAAAEGRWWAAAAASALAGMFKPHALPTGLLLAAAWPKQMSWRLALATAVGAALPFAAGTADYAGDQYRTWWAWVTADDRTAALFERAGRDLFLLFRLWLAPPDPATYRAIQLGVAAALAGLCLAARLRGLPGAETAALALHSGCIWMTLLGPATESSTYTLLAPTLAVLLLSAWRARPSPVARPLATAAAALLFTATGAAMFPESWRTQALGLQPLAALMLLALPVLDTVPRLLRPGTGGATAGVGAVAERSDLVE